MSAADQQIIDEKREAIFTKLDQYRDRWPEDSPNRAVVESVCNGIRNVVLQVEESSSDGKIELNPLVLMLIGDFLKESMDTLHALDQLRNLASNL